jgi:TPR repeat protein
MVSSVQIVLLLLLIGLAQVCFSEKYGIGELEIAIGEKEGIRESSSISHETLQKILAGVENGNKDNIYYFGLLKMYGISVSKDLGIAAQNFQRASSLGHKEGTTAYGVMLLTGNGVKQDLGGAMKYFRRGVELGDMVCITMFDLFHVTH